MSSAQALCSGTLKTFWIDLVSRGGVYFDHLCVGRCETALLLGSSAVRSVAEAVGKITNKCREEKWCSMPILQQKPLHQFSIVAKKKRGEAESKQSTERTVIAAKGVEKYRGGGDCH